MKSKVILYTAEWSQKEIERKLTRAKKSDPNIEGYSFNGYLNVPSYLGIYEYIFCTKDQFESFAKEFGYR